METTIHSRSLTKCSSTYQRRTEIMCLFKKQWTEYLNIRGRVLPVSWKSIMHHCLNILTHSHNYLIINDNSNYLLVYIWSTHRLLVTMRLVYIWSTHRLLVTMRMIPYSMNVIQLNRLLVRITWWVFQWMVCHCSMYHSLRVIQMIYNTNWMKEDYPI